MAGRTAVGSPSGQVRALEPRARVGVKREDATLTLVNAERSARLAKAGANHGGGSCTETC